MLPKIFRNDLDAIGKNKTTLTLNKPACIGICILDCAWCVLCIVHLVLMYEFHYDYIKNKYGNNSRLYPTLMV